MYCGSMNPFRANAPQELAVWKATPTSWLARVFTRMKRRFLVYQGRTVDELNQLERRMYRVRLFLWETTCEKHALKTGLSVKEVQHLYMPPRFPKRYGPQ